MRGGLVSAVWRCTLAYLQAGAPSEVAMLSGSAASFTKIAHVTFAAPVRLLFVIDASQPPPAEIGRASCRERVKTSVDGGALIAQAMRHSLLLRSLET